MKRFEVTLTPRGTFEHQPREIIEASHYVMNKNGALTFVLGLEKATYAPGAWASVHLLKEEQETETADDQT